MAAITQQLSFVVILTVVYGFFLWLLHSYVYMYICIVRVYTCYVIVGRCFGHKLTRDSSLISTTRSRVAVGMRALL